MRDFIADASVNLAGIILLAAILGFVWPRLLLLRSRPAVLGWCTLAFIACAIVGSAAETDIHAGSSAFTSKNWETAVTRLAAVPQTDAMYDSAQALLLRARPHWARAQVRQARDLIGDEDYDDALRLLGTIPTHDPAIAAQVTALREVIDWKEHYRTLHYAPAAINLRRGPGESHAVTGSLKRHDAVQLGKPDRTGWAVVHRRHDYDGNGIITGAGFAAPLDIAKDTIGFVLASFLTTETPSITPDQDPSTSAPSRTFDDRGCQRLREVGRATESAMEDAIKADRAEERRNGPVIPGQERQFLRHEEAAIRHGIEMTLLYEQMKVDCAR